MGGDEVYTRPTVTHMHSSRWTLPGRPCLSVAVFRHEAPIPCLARTTSRGIHATRSLATGKAYGSNPEPRVRTSWPRAPMRTSCTSPYGRRVDLRNKAPRRRARMSKP